MKLAVIFGGASTEHDVSVVSGTSVLKNLDKNKYNILPIYIDKEGNWYEYTKNINEIEIAKIGEELTELKKLDNIMETLQKQDVLFPVLHGLYGEDGTIQGLFEILKKPYVGCKVLASSVAMDKVYTKIVLEKAKIPQVKSEYIRKYQDKYIYIDKEFNEALYELDELTKILEEKLPYPMFIKPSNSGSSVGVNKAETKEELKRAIEHAGLFDKKILIEQGITGREVETAVLGNEEIQVSEVGEIKAAEEFYTFDAKYNNQASKTIIPAEIPKEQKEKIRTLAKKAFKAIDGSGLSRVDFFIEDKTNQIYLNEINTMPGFTTISMYPKLFEAIGINYSNLLDKLIELA